MNILFKDLRNILEKKNSYKNDMTTFPFKDEFKKLHIIINHYHKVKEIRSQEHVFYMRITEVTQISANQYHIHYT